MSEPDRPPWGTPSRTLLAARAYAHKTPGQDAPAAEVLEQFFGDTGGGGRMEQEQDAKAISHYVDDHFHELTREAIDFWKKAHPDEIPRRAREYAELEAMLGECLPQKKPEPAASAAPAAPTPAPTLSEKEKLLLQKQKLLHEKRIVEVRILVFRALEVMQKTPRGRQAIKVLNETMRRIEKRDAKKKTPVGSGKEINK